MIAEPPSALSMFIRRMLEKRAANRIDVERSGTVDGGRLLVEPERRALPAPKDKPEGSTALVSPSVPPALPPVDITALPDRDHLRTVVLDFDHIQYE